MCVRAYARARVCADVRARATVPRRCNLLRSVHFCSGQDILRTVPLSRDFCKCLKSLSRSFYPLWDSTVPVFCKCLKKLGTVVLSHCPEYLEPRTQEACEIASHRLLHRLSWCESVSFAFVGVHAVSSIEFQQIFFDGTGVSNGEFVGAL